jgi:hypothetical protein
MSGAFVSLRGALFDAVLQPAEALQCEQRYMHVAASQIDS